jgi:molybdopterin converting factor small subunit
MLIQVQYTAPLTEFTGKRHESLELPQGAALRDLLHRLGELHGPRLWRTFYNHAQEFQPMFMVTRNGTLVEVDDVPLAEGDQIALVAHFAGG